MSGTVPVVVTQAGMTPRSPATLQQLLLTNVAATNPGYTANLPGTLIEDISSTSVGALLIIDAAMVDTVNSVTPFGINEFMLTQLGNVYGVTQGAATNTSVYCVFSGTPGYVVQIGFTVSDGTYQYVVQDGGVIQTDGQSAPLYCLSTTAGTFAVPAGTVTKLVTSVPANIGLTVTNPNTGTPGTGTAESYPAYRARVLQAGLAAAQGMPDFVKSKLQAISGVQARLVAVQQQTNVGWKVICGGGDPYAVAYAIYRGLFDISTLVGSSISSSRTITVTLPSPPDAYTVTFVNPVQQSVIVQLLWGTSALNYVSQTAVATLAQPALVAYVNSLQVGQPINLFELQAAFQASVTTVLATALITRMVFTVTINGTVVNPESGTGIIAGDPEGYFLTTTAAVIVQQG